MNKINWIHLTWFVQIFCHRSTEEKYLEIDCFSNSIKGCSSVNSEPLWL